ncbi:MAG: hypothetical protein NDI61_01780 [Bdellovibrionaceae bacterium]|nr:hypothetical protein [Pseudobdellovibrionaceae bacterium]
MKHLIWLAALGLVTGCSSTPTQPDGYHAGLTVYTPVPEGNVTPLRPGDRTPAGTPRLFWAEQSKDIAVGPAGGVTHFGMTIERVQQWEEQEAYTDTRWVTKTFWEPGVCSDWDCSQSQGGGSSPLWDAFYSATRDRKAKALADAIQGVGMASAEKLIAANVFHRKPRSWEAFKDAIRSAERAGYINKDIVYQVTVKYANENLVNLGYTQTSCRPYTYSCELLVEKSVQETFTNYRTVTRSSVVESFPRRFEVVVRDPKLQPFEQDLIRVTAGREPSDVRVSADSYTRYSQQMSVQSDVTRVELVGQERIKVGLPNAAVTRSSYQLRGNTPVFTVAVDPKYIPQAAGNDQLVIHYRVRSCKTTLGICGRKTDSEQMVHPVTGTETNIEIKNVKGLKSWVIFSLSRKNSPWYNDSPLAERETDDVKQK